MSIFSIIFMKKHASIGGITVDAAVREVHESSCEITENEVEEGADVSDHVQMRPKTLMIEGIITDTPVTFSVINAATGLIDTAASIFGNSSRSKDAYDQLLELQEKRQPFQAVTGLKVYDNMILKRLSVPRTARTGNAIHFTAMMQQILVARSGGPLGASLSPDVASLGTSTKDLGKKVSDVVPAESPIATGAAGVTSGTQETKGASYLFDAYESLRGAF